MLACHMTVVQREIQHDPFLVESILRRVPVRMNRRLRQLPSTEYPRETGTVASNRIVTQSPSDTAVVETFLEGLLMPPSRHPAAELFPRRVGGRTVGLVAAGDEEIELVLAVRNGPEDRAGFMKDYGLTETASARLIRAAYELMGLQSFFTMGEDEVRAWTVSSRSPRQK